MEEIQKRRGEKKEKREEERMGVPNLVYYDFFESNGFLRPSQEVVHEVLV